MIPRELAPSSTWFTSIFAKSHVAIGISRLADSRFVAVNDAFLRLFGYKRREVVGRTSLELGLWPQPAERANLMRALRRGEPVTAFEAGYRKRSGAIGDLQISARILKLGGEDCVVGQLTDISDRKRAERISQLHEARLETVLQLSEILVFHQDRKLRYTWIANPSLGVTTAQLIGRTDDEILGKQAARPLTSIKRRVLRTGRGERTEVWVSNKDQTGCYDLIVEPERDAQGRLTGLVCAAIDITQRKRIEEHLQLQATIVENLAEGVNLVDAQGLLRYTNPRFDAMFGYAAGELIGQGPAVLNAKTDIPPEKTTQTILDTLQRKGRWSGSIRNRRKDGSEFLTQANIVAAHHPKFGRVWISIQSDVTALRQAEEARDAANRAVGHLANHVRDTMEHQRREIAREVHDQIGATLTGIRLRLQAVMDAPSRRDLEEVSALLDQALDTTRNLCTQLRPPMLDDLGLSETMRWYVHEWSRQTGIRSTLRIHAVEIEPADPLRIDLFRMLQELLTNVARHARARHVGITLRHASGSLRLRVKDDGQGFRTGTTDGFGLLGIRERLRNHGALMHIDSTDRGTSITLDVPETRP